MFQWDKSLTALRVPVTRVNCLYRSMRDVQVALPGLPSQEATAYLCQHQSGENVATLAAFHLHKSGRLAFYREARSEVPAGKADSMLDQGLVFLESMGFLMTDLDLHLLDEADRGMLWDSLPLQAGDVAPEAPPAAPRTPGASPQPQPAAAPPAAPAPSPPSLSAVPEAGTAEEVDDLLAAVEALRTRRPGVRTRKQAPDPGELGRRRRELRENLGRILASM